jgi:ammonium transporter, Amt family
MGLDIGLILLGAIALLGRVGLALYITGLVRSKNSAGTVTRVLCDTCISALVFWAIGAAILLQGRNGVFFIDRSLLFGWVVDRSAVIFFHLTIFLLATGVLVGAVSERCRFFSLCVASAVLAGLVLPVSGGWAWLGWLKTWGFVDIGGASALHLAAGIFAAIGAIMVGPRTGKFNRDGSSTMIPGHNMPLASIGSMLLFVAWIGCLAGRSIYTPVELRQIATVAGPVLPDSVLMAMAAYNTLLSAAAAGFAAMVLGQLRYGKPDVVLTLMGMLGGLVAISGGAGAISTPGAVLIGAVAGVAVPLMSIVIDLRLRVDDPTGLVAVHGVGGAWGTIAVALFAHLPTFASHGTQLLKQVVGLLVIGAFSAGVSWIVFAVLKATVGIRAREADEFDGLDLAEHDIGAYPDFQQTMIKSYHLREV